MLKMVGPTDNMKIWTPTKPIIHKKKTVEGQDVVLNSSKVEKHDFGCGNDTTFQGWMTPSFAVNKQLTFKMGGFVENYNLIPK